jgi:hypothetical protein
LNSTLQATTLRDAGITGGNAVIRLSFRPTDSKAEVPSKSDVENATLFPTPAPTQDTIPLQQSVASFDEMPSAHAIIAPVAQLTESSNSPSIMDRAVKILPPFDGESAQSNSQCLHSPCSD